LLESSHEPLPVEHIVVDEQLDVALVADGTGTVFPVAFNTGVCVVGVGAFPRVGGMLAEAPFETVGEAEVPGGTAGPCADEFAPPPAMLESAVPIGPADSPLPPPPPGPL
jgi:hypothetical protein